MFLVATLEKCGRTEDFMKFVLEWRESPYAKVYREWVAKDTSWFYQDWERVREYGS